MATTKQPVNLPVRVNVSPTPGQEQMKETVDVLAEPALRQAAVARMDADIEQLQEQIAFIRRIKSAFKNPDVIALAELKKRPPAPKLNTAMRVPASSTTVPVTPEDQQKH